MSTVMSPALHCSISMFEAGLEGASVDKTVFDELPFAIIKAFFEGADVLLVIRVILAIAMSETVEEFTFIDPLNIHVVSMRVVFAAFNLSNEECLHHHLFVGTQQEIPTGSAFEFELFGFSSHAHGQGLVFPVVSHRLL